MANDDSANAPINSPTRPVRRTALAAQFEKDRKEVLWEKSLERQEFAKKRLTFLISGGIILVVGLAMLFTSESSDDHSLDLLVGGSFVIVAAIVGTGFSIHQLHLSYQYKFHRNQRLGLIESIDQKTEELAATAVDGKLDLPSLWANTQERLSTYHSIATDQAANSFRVGQRFAVGGFLLILTAGVAAVFAHTPEGSIAAGAVGVVGAAMSSYIGATFMKSQSEASAQLREFFNQPVEFSRVLSIERLIQTLEEKDRPAAVQDVIRSMMPSGSSLSKSDGE